MAPLPCPPGLLLTQPDKNIAVVKRCFKLGNSMCQSSINPTISPAKLGLVYHWVCQSSSSSKKKFCPAANSSNSASKSGSVWEKHCTCDQDLTASDPLITGQFNGG